MSGATVLRWCAITTIAAGVMEIVVTLIEVFIPDGAFSVQAADDLWSVQQVPNWIAKLLLLWSLVGFYSREVRQAGRFGFAAFVVAFAGTALEFAVEVAIYRIVQEALTNTVRHADARFCTVRLDFTDQVRIDITDDGIGIRPQPRSGVGLVSMRERAIELGGSFDVGAVSNGGTRVAVAIPCPPTGCSVGASAGRNHTRLDRADGDRA